MSGLSAGIYNVTATDNNACIETGSYTLTNPSLLVITETHSDPSCNTGVNGSIDITVAGGTAGYTYDWTTANGSGIVINQEDQTSLTGGTYDIVVTDANSCSQSLNINLTDPNALLVSELITDVDCNGNSTGAIDLSVTGGTSPYNYNWENQANPGVSIGTNQDVSSLDAGTYCVDIVDNGPCPISKCISIVEPSVITATTTVTNANCNGETGEILVTASGGTGTLEYSIDAVNYQSSNIFTGIVANNYTITLRDVNNCIGTTNATIAEPTTITATTTVVDASCNGDASGGITVNASGGTGALEYSIDAINYQSSNIFTGLLANNYTITLRDANSCTGTTNATITEPTLITATTTVVDASCNGDASGEITVNASGGTGAFEYSIDAINYQTSNIFTGLVANNYTITVRDINSCTVTTNATIAEPTEITATPTTSNASCNGLSDGIITINAVGGTGGLQYSIDAINYQSSNVFTGLIANTYTIIAKDVNGCSDTINATITEPTLINVSINSADVLCNGGSDGILSVTAVGGTGVLEYSIDAINYQTSNILTGLYANMYTVVVRDDNNCKIYTDVTVIEPAIITSTTSVTDASCNGASDGMLAVNASGGTGALEYSIDAINYQTSNIFAGLVANNYTIITRDVNNCSDTINVTVAEPTVVAATVFVTDASCNGDANGEITVNATGGTGVLEYSIDAINYQTSNIFIGLLANTYTITIRDANLCTITTDATIAEPTLITATTSVIDVSCNGDANGEITVNAINGTGTLEYSLDAINYQSSNIFTGLLANTYTITVRDANACTVTNNTTILEPSLITATTIANVVCYGETGEIIVNATGGTGTLEYSLDAINYQASNIFTGLAPTTYTITVRDINNCTIAIVETIIEAEELLSYTSATEGSCLYDYNGIATVYAQGGTEPYTYNWDNNEWTASASSLSTGYHTVTVTDNNGCIFIDDVTIETAANSSINGIAQFSLGYIAAGDAFVVLYEASSHPFNEIDRVDIGINGTFEFNNISEGNYVINVKLYNHAFQYYPGVMQTYYGFTHKWQDAEHIHLNCVDSDSIIVQMVENPSSTNGNNSVSGNINYGSPLDKTLPGEPVPGAEVFTEQDPNDEPITETTTLGDGSYILSGLPEGVYYLRVDIPGILQFSTHTFMITELSTIIENFNFIVDTSITNMGIYADTEVSVSDIHSSKIEISTYPNPTSQYINVAYKLKNRSNINIQVINTDSKIIDVIDINRNELEGVIKIDLLNYSKGSYFLKFEINNTVIIKKIIMI